MPEFQAENQAPGASAQTSARQDAQIKNLRTRRKQERGKQMMKMIGGIAVGGGLLLGAVGGIGSAFNGGLGSNTGWRSMPYQPTYSVPPTYTGIGSVPLTNTKLTRMPPFLLRMAVALTASAALIGGGLFFYARGTRRRYIKLDKIGILISDSPKSGEGDARFIPWGCLSAVDVLYPGKQSPTLNEHEIEQFAQDALTKAPPVVIFYVDDGSTLKINWHDLTACIEPGSFINELKTWAPDASGACKFPGEEEIRGVGNKSFTQLWFKYYTTASDRKRTTQLIDGETLQDGRYTIAGKLGSGGQGTAYLAVDKEPSPSEPSEVVLKEYILPLHRGQQVLEQTLQKLHQEAAILRKIEHKNIVRMLGEFSEDHRGYLIMEYVSGKPLKAMVAQEGALPESTVKELALQLCDILECLHGMTPPVVHRDLTPDNLILQEDGVVKLVDFNVAHQLESAATATVVGKHAYIPPEQFRGKPTVQSDIYAFGCTIYYLLTGEDPEPLTVSHPRLTNEHVSEELDSLVASCTALDATKRYADIAQVRASLLSMSDNSSGHKIKVPKSSFSNA